ncbi:MULTISPECIES: hypothetical protein [unclassified Microcoleus]|uniref:hypothetical protein n=1 Tax=unclassified Microcoleus TaxID=2642155 RepID=UPI0025D30CCE|nr:MULTISPECIES: hypothetical protein [unclassified Microcoleus]
MKSTVHHFQTAKTFYQSEKWHLDSWFEVTHTRQHLQTIPSCRWRQKIPRQYYNHEERAIKLCQSVDSIALSIADGVAY